MNQGSLYLIIPLANGFWCETSMLTNPTVEMRCFSVVEALSLLLFTHPHCIALPIYATGIHMMRLSIKATLNRLKTNVWEFINFRRTSRVTRSRIVFALVNWNYVHGILVMSVEPHRWLHLWWSLWTTAKLAVSANVKTIGCWTNMGYLIGPRAAGNIMLDAEIPWFRRW